MEDQQRACQTCDAEKLSSVQGASVEGRKVVGPGTGPPTRWGRNRSLAGNGHRKWAKTEWNTQLAAARLENVLRCEARRHHRRL